MTGSEEMNVCVIVCAGGGSTRFGRNKLDEDLGGRPVLQRAVEAFTKHPRIDSIVVAGPKNDYEAFTERHGDKLGLMGCVVCPGGETHRWETVKAALEHVPEGTTHIAVHDGARCLTGSELIDRVLDAALAQIEGGGRRGAVVPGIEVTDTLKRVGDEVGVAEEDPLDAILGDAGKPRLGSRLVEETVDRKGLVSVQTPQMFEADLLRRAYAQDDLSSTDDAGLVERLGEAVHVVEGDPLNIKLTTPADLRLARAILGMSGGLGEGSSRATHKRF